MNKKLILMNIHHKIQKIQKMIVIMIGKKIKNRRMKIRNKNLKK